MTDKNEKPPITDWNGWEVGKYITCPVCGRPEEMQFGGGLRNCIHCSLTVHEACGSFSERSSADLLQPWWGQCDSCRYGDD